MIGVQQPVISNQEPPAELVKRLSISRGLDQELWISQIVLEGVSQVVAVAEVKV